MRVYNGGGTTSVFEEHGIAAEVLRVYKDLRERGELTVRSHLVVSPSWSTAGGASIAALLEIWNPGLAGRGLGDDVLRVSGLYAEASAAPDNAVRARALPYTGWAGFSYDAPLPRARARTVLLEAARAGIRVVSLGTDLLDFYEEVDHVVPIADRRWVIGHISTLTGDEIKRIRDLGVVLTTHTNRYLSKEGEILRARVGTAEDTIVPLRSLQEAGVHFALATDNVPSSLFHPVWHCVARTDRYSNRVIAPSQRISREDALRACTIEGAYLTFDENVKGSLEPGKLADLAVLSDDPLTVEEERLRDIVAEVTIVGGRVVFERGAP